MQSIEHNILCDNNPAEKCRIIIGNIQTYVVDCQGTCRRVCKHRYTTTVAIIIIEFNSFLFCQSDQVWISKTHTQPFITPIAVVVVQRMAVMCRHHDHPLVSVHSHGGLVLSWNEQQEVAVSLVATFSKCTTPVLTV